MTVAIVGSRSLDVDIPDGLITEEATHIISGGAKGIDRSARRYSEKHRIVITEILPEYDLYGRNAPLIRNDVIIRHSDIVYVFWDGKSRGTRHVINECRKKKKPYSVYIWKGGRFEPIAV